MSNNKSASSEIQAAQRLFDELLDQWKPYHEAARELRLKVASTFSDVAKGGRLNPDLDILAMLESMEDKERELQAKMDELVNSIKG